MFYEIFCTVNTNTSIIFLASFNFSQSIPIQKRNLEQNVFQAEDSLLSRGEVQSLYSGFTGTGYVYLVNKAGAYVEILFRKKTAALDTIYIYFSNGSGSIRNLDLSVNETSLGNISFERTSEWSTWTTLKIAASFQSGVNHVRLTAVGTSSNPFIDKISISGSSAISVFKLALSKEAAELFLLTLQKFILMKEVKYHLMQYLPVILFSADGLELLKVIQIHLFLILKSTPR